MRRSRLVVLLCAAGAVLGTLAWHVSAPDSLAQQAETSGSFSGPADHGKEYEGLAQVWIEATFIQVDTVDLDKVKSSLGNPLDPLTGKIALTGEEKAALLAALKDRPSFEVLGSASLVTCEGSQALMQMVEEIRYPTEYEGEGSDELSEEDEAKRTSGAVVVPATFEIREAGIRLNVTPYILSDRRTITLALLPEVSNPAGYMTYGPSKVFSQPVFTSWDLTTTLAIKDGQTLVLTGVPTKNFEQSYLLNPQQAEGLKGKKSALLLISAKIVDPGKKQ